MITPITVSVHSLQSSQILLIFIAPGLGLHFQGLTIIVCQWCGHSQLGEYTERLTYIIQFLRS